MRQGLARALGLERPAQAHVLRVVAGPGGQPQGPAAEERIGQRAPMSTLRRRELRLAAGDDLLPAGRQAREEHPFPHPFDVGMSKDRESRNQQRR